MINSIDQIDSFEFNTDDENFYIGFGNMNTDDADQKQIIQE